VPAPWSALRDWMSLSRTSCNNNMHYYPLSLSPPPPGLSFASSSLSSLSHQGLSCGYSYPSLRCCVCVLFLSLISLLAADVVTLSFLPTSLAAHTHFRGEILRFFNGIIWSIILSLLRRVELLFNTSQLVSRPWIRWSTTGHSLLSTKVLIAFDVSHLFGGPYRNNFDS